VVENDAPMSTPSSAAGNLPMPQWAYVPGETEEADADYETLAQAKLLVPSRFRDYVPARHPALRYGIALNDRGYFWEAQEILEAVWAAAPQGGRERILLRACIQIANANLRLRMMKPHPAARLLGEALAGLDTLGARKTAAAGDGFVDAFPTAALAALLKTKLALPSLSKADWVALGTVGRT
jgi:predicted metal-dependent hydrolase